MKKVLFLFFIISGSISSDFFVGEIVTENYEGGLDPAFEINKELKFKFKDEDYINQFIWKNIDKEILISKEKFLNNLKNYSTCPVSELEKEIPYIRYLFRLITISYLIEAMKDSYKTLYLLNQDVKFCDYKFENIFSKCSPKGINMKRFLSRVGHFLLREKNNQNYFSLSHFQIDAIVSRIKYSQIAGSLTQKRIMSECDKRGNCKKSNIKSIVRDIKSFCGRDKKMINLLCSEDDLLFGASYIDGISKIISNSHLANTTSFLKYGDICLKYYSKVQKTKEREYLDLKFLIPNVIENLKSKKTRLIEGGAFILGSLRKFDERGLKDFVFKKQAPIKIKKKIIVLKKKKKKEIPKIKLNKIKKTIQGFTPKKKVFKKKKKIEIHVSPFENSYQEFVKRGRTVDIPVEMKEFINQKKFTKKQVLLFKEPIKKFQKRVVLEEFKKIHSLGTKKQPLRLSFLKYMIQENEHRELWNVVSVFGEEFYILNDLERKKNAILILLKNNETTNYNWRITIRAESL